MSQSIIIRLALRRLITIYLSGEVLRMESIQEILINQGIKARKAARFLATASTNVKNEALNAMADSLEAGKAEILTANALDLEQGARQG
jgi:glutamate-5-semialdehyde dehydrogenase